LALPRYILEIRERDWSITRDEVTMSEGESVEVGHRFEHEGRTLRVAIVQESKRPYVRKLVCTPT
jgi:hypothetical protein